MARSTTVMSKFATWALGYDVGKADYPEPWRSAPETVFTSGRVLTEVAKLGATGRVPANIVCAIHEMHDMKYNYGRSGHTLWVEICMEPGKTYLYVGYCVRENAIRGCYCTVQEDGSTDVTPIEVGRGHRAAMGCLLSIMLGLAASTPTEVKEFVSITDLEEEPCYAIGKLVSELLNTRLGGDAELAAGEMFSALGGLLYAAIKKGGWLTSGIAGISEGGTIEMANLGEILDAASRRNVFALHADVVDGMEFHPSAAVVEREAGTLLLTRISTPKGEDPHRRFTFEEHPAAGGASRLADMIDSMAGASTSESTVASPAATDWDALRRELKLDIHPLTEKEQDLVPALSPAYVLDDRLLEMARDIKGDWHQPVDLAPNYILEGDSGSGKTEATYFFANMFGIPRTKITMSPTFESADLIGAFYPVFKDTTDWGLDDADNEALRVVEGCLPSATAGKDLATEIRNAFAKAEVRNALRAAWNIPGADDIAFDPEGAWHMMGMDGAAPDATDLSILAGELFEDKLYRLLNVMLDKTENGKISYRFIESELMQAFKHGWLVEIQEAASVLRPGVLTQLNSLLEPNGRIELPNGEFIHRHPDTIVVITTNRDYQGNVDLNESLRDRCLLGEKMDLPPAEVMARRAMSQTGFDDYSVALEAAKTIEAVAEEAKDKGIAGSFGMRSLIGWMLKLKQGDHSERTFLKRVIYKMTTRDDDVQLLLTTYRANCGLIK